MLDKDRVYPKTEILLVPLSLELNLGQPFAGGHVIDNDAGGDQERKFVEVCKVRREETCLGCPWPHACKLRRQELG